MERSVKEIFENTTTEEIGVAKHCAPTQQGFIRYQALEQLYRSKSKKEVGELSDRSVRTIERWIFLFRERGIDGLALKGSSFLDEFAKHTAETEPDKSIIMVLDNDSWHHHSKLNWHHITPCYLPAYSPDFNPIEQIRRVLKERFFANWIAKTPEQLIERLCQAIRSLLAGEISSIASIDNLLH